MRRPNRPDHGFTLAEAILLLAIVALLAILISCGGGTRSRSRRSRLTAAEGRAQCTNQLRRVGHD